MASSTYIDIEAVTDTEAVVIPDPLTVNSLIAHRENAPKLVAGVAAWTNSDMFKIPVCITVSQLEETVILTIFSLLESQKLNDGIVSTFQKQKYMQPY
jgi:aromatic amino acid aminotransferase I